MGHQGELVPHSVEIEVRSRHWLERLGSALKAFWLFICSSHSCLISPASCSLLPWGGRGSYP